MWPIGMTALPPAVNLLFFFAMALHSPFYILQKPETAYLAVVDNASTTDLFTCARIVFFASHESLVMPLSSNLKCRRGSAKG